MRRILAAATLLCLTGQPPFHGDGRGVDRTRPDHRSFAIGTTGRVACPVGVALASFAILGLALAGVVLDIRDRRRSELEVDRMRDLADASVEGLVVCDGEAIISVNTSFAALTGLSASNHVGARLEDCFPDKTARIKLLSGSTKRLKRVCAIWTVR